MRKLILVGAALFWLCSAPLTQAVVIFADSFDYTNGPLVSVNGSPWVTHSGTTGQVQVVSGRVFLSQTNSEDVSAYLPGQPYPPATNIFLYASFTVNFTAVPSGDGGYFAHFKDSNTGFNDKIYATTNGVPTGFFGIGVANSSSTAPGVLLSSNLSFNTDYVLVTRYVVSNATSTLWLNPSAETDPSVAATDTPSTHTIIAYALRESLSGGSGMGSLYFDNLVIGTSFSDVVATAAGVPPSIMTQPQSQTVTEGSNVTFSVVATGTPAPTYQWQFQGTNLAGATSSVLSLPSVTTNQAGAYTVGITNSAGWTNSQPATLTVNLAPPVITVQPQDQTVTEGATASFSVGAQSTAPLSYQWQFYATNLPGATLSSLTLPGVTTNQSGPYSVTVTNVAGATNSQTANLTVLPAASAPLSAFSYLTYNVEGNGATDWSTNTAQAQAIGRQLEYLNPDIITFNEIPYNYTWQMTNWITAFLPGYYMATNSGTDGFIRSVIASRFPIRFSQKWLDGVSLAAFGYSGNFTRDLFQAQIAVPGFVQPLDVFVTHLKATTSSPQDDANKRAAEASAISNFFVNVYLPGTNGSHAYVLSGDMNEDVFWPETNKYTSAQPIQRLVSLPTGLQLTTPDNPITHTDLTESIQAKLDVRFDYILPCGLLFSNIAGSQVFRTDLLTNPAPPTPLLTNDDITSSDHLPVMMVFGNPYVFQLTSIEWTNQSAVLHWGSISGGVYQVAHKESLTDANWAAFDNSITGRPSSLSWTDATANLAPRRFYRVSQVR